jgi:hypothetical protein
VRAGPEARRRVAPSRPPTQGAPTTAHAASERADTRGTNRTSRTGPGARPNAAIRLPGRSDTPEPTTDRRPGDREARGGARRPVRRGALTAREAGAGACDRKTESGPSTPNMASERADTREANRTCRTRPGALPNAAIRLPGRSDTPEPTTDRRPGDLPGRPPAYGARAPRAGGGGNVGPARAVRLRRRAAPGLRRGCSRHPTARAGERLRPRRPGHGTGPGHRASGGPACRRPCRSGGRRRRRSRANGRTR